LSLLVKLATNKRKSQDIERRRKINKLVGPSIRDKRKHFTSSTL